MMNDVLACLLRKVKKKNKENASGEKIDENHRQRDRNNKEEKKKSIGKKTATKQKLREKSATFVQLELALWRSRCSRRFALDIFFALRLAML